MTLIMAKFLIGLSLLSATFEGLSAQQETLNPEGCGISHSKTMIVNGTAVKENQYPWAVFLETDFAEGLYGCGGTIITKRHVLTAAHCFFVGGFFVQKIVVIYGSVDRHLGKQVEASKVLVHKDYNHVTKANDIGLLEVEYPFQFSNDVAPICLPTAPVKLANKDAVVAGWGALYLHGNGTDFLRHTTVTFLPDQLCRKIFKDQRYSDAIQSCAQKRGKGACKGDSGGPVMIRTGDDRFQQVGIVSYLVGVCGGDFNPQVYTRVSAYINWLTRGVSSSAGYTPLGSPKPYMPISPPFFI
uniref:Putative tick serine protease n=1 Tax=Rhipicephalus pulchellus TaxID=72859 RepID=L7M8A1_RHIPC